MAHSDHISYGNDGLCLEQSQEPFSYATMAGAPLWPTEKSLQGHLKFSENWNGQMADKNQFETGLPSGAEAISCDRDCRIFPCRLWQPQNSEAGCLTDRSPFASRQQEDLTAVN